MNATARRSGWRSPRTEYQITAAGLAALATYKSAMDDLLAPIGGNT